MIWKWIYVYVILKENKWLKIKTDFVTNSSSASFIIERDKITDIQLHLIKNHVSFCKDYHPDAISYIGGDNSGWRISYEDSYISGYTSMDNFDMRWFLLEIGIKEEDIKYDHS